MEALPLQKMRKYGEARRTVLVTWHLSALVAIQRRSELIAIGCAWRRWRATSTSHVYAFDKVS